MIRKWLGLSLTLLPILGQFALVFFLGVNSVTADETVYLRFMQTVREGGPWIPMLWNLHNEHRVIPMKLVMAALGKFGSWNIKAEMYVSAILAALMVLALWRIYKSIGGKDLLRFAPVPALVCSFAQFENMLFGMQMCQYFTTAGVTGAIALLTMAGTPAFLGAIACGVVASSSVLNGLLVWPAGQWMLFAARASRARQFGWAFAGVATTLVYFWRFTPPPGMVSHPARWAVLYPALKYASLLAGLPLHGGSYFWARAAGIVVTLAALIAAISWLRSGARRQLDAAPAALIIFGMLSCLAIGLGRGASSGDGIASRYIAHAVFVLFGLYLLLAADVERGDAGPSRFAFWSASLGLLVPGLIAANIQGFQHAKLWRTMQLNQRYALQNFELMPDEVLQFGGPPEAARRLRSLLPYFRDHRLIHFADPQDLVLLQNPASRQDTPEVLAGMPVEQRLPCPVVALHDIAVHLKATAPPLNDFTASLTVWDGNQLLGKRDLPDEIIGEGWVDIPLQKTVEHCTGHPLRIRLETDDRIPGGGVVAATYLHYYHGSLSVPGWPADTQQTLGITVNVRKRLEYETLARSPSS